jgi:tRNA (uracil-5-)-methyltransferase TRM9
LDISKKLVELASEKYPQGRFFEGDVLRIPFEDNYFDNLLSISVAHHIPGGDLRERFIKEQARVLKPGGKMLIRVWDMRLMPEVSKDLLKNTFLKIIGQNKMDFGDVMRPWKDSEQKTVAQRYFHCFSEHELASLLQKADLQVIKVWKEGKPPTAMSIFAIAKKIK